MLTGESLREKAQSYLYGRSVLLLADKMNNSRTHAEHRNLIIKEGLNGVKKGNRKIKSGKKLVKSQAPANTKPPIKDVLKETLKMLFIT